MSSHTICFQGKIRKISNVLNVQSVLSWLILQAALFLGHKWKDKEAVGFLVSD